MQGRPKDNLQSHPETVVQYSGSEYRCAFGANVKELTKVSMNLYFSFEQNFFIASRFLSIKIGGK